MAAMTPELQSARRNRRRRVRHKVHTPAYASFTNEAKGYMLDLNEIVDISEDGVAIQCSSPLPMNQRLDLCLDLAETTGHIYTTGLVIWSSASGRCGLRFSDLPPASLFHLREWLFFNAMAGVASAQTDESSFAPRTVDAAPIRPNYTDTLAALSAVQREVDSLGPDLVAALQLVAARAQALVKATGAAIALAGAEPDVMVCRASAGPDAPPVGARLQVGSGFSGECVRTGRLLRCDDAETDGRVDRDSCRALGIRSILAAPVRVGEKVIGILEVFCPHPNAFGETESTVLQRLAETVLAAVNRAARIENTPPPASRPPFPASPGSVLFASGGTDTDKDGKEKEMGKANLEGRSSGGIRLPLSNLIVLICAAATIALVLGFFLAPWVQEKLKARGNLHEQTVLASSPPAVTPNPSSGPSVATATFPQLRELAERGNPAAENALGIRYYKGDERNGVKPDEKEAVRWFTRAATHGDLDAQSKLAYLYWGGRAVPKDSNQAYFWAVLARARGEKGSKDLARVLAAGMTRAQTTAIEQQAEMWLQQHQSESATKADVSR